MSDKIIGKIHIAIAKDEDDEVKFDWGYEIDDDEIRLNDLAMLNSFIDKIKLQAQDDFNERLEKSDKEFEVKSDGY
jgi:hypothetical protein